MAGGLGFHCFAWLGSTLLGRGEVSFRCFPLSFPGVLQFLGCGKCSAPLLFSIPTQPTSVLPWCLNSSKVTLRLGPQRHCIFGCRPSSYPWWLGTALPFSEELIEGTCCSLASQVVGFSGFKGQAQGRSLRGNTSTASSPFIQSPLANLVCLGH